jgi:NTP pyrophosphatase (non-canonical NTP hydrolase)
MTMDIMDKHMSISHPNMVKVLVKPGVTIANEMSGYNAHLIHMIMGVSGEVGELLDAIKKSVIYQKPMDMENIVEEFGDIEFYLEGLRQGLGISRQDTLKANINKLSVRYEGFNYSDTAAQTRADKA